MTNTRKRSGSACIGRPGSEGRSMVGSFQEDRNGIWLFLGEQIRNLDTLSPIETRKSRWWRWCSSSVIGDQTIRSSLATRGRAKNGW